MVGVGDRIRLARFTPRGSCVLSGRVTWVDYSGGLSLVGTNETTGAHLNRSLAHQDDLGTGWTQNITLLSKGPAIPLCEDWRPPNLVTVADLHQMGWDSLGHIADPVGLDQLEVMRALRDTRQQECGERHRFTLSFIHHPDEKMRCLTER